MKRQKSNKSTAAKILIGILCLVLLLIAAGLCYYQFYVKPNLIEPIQDFYTDNNNSELPQLTGDILLEELENVLRETDVQEYINRENPNQSDVLISMIEEAKNRDKAPPQESVPAASEAPATTPTPTEKPAEGSKLDKLKSQVEAKDLTDGLALSGKVDIGYVLGLLSGGLTPEERKELKSYLMQHLSSSEISRGIELFTKYSYLM